MLSQDERFLIGLKVLERLKPSLRGRQNYANPPLSPELAVEDSAGVAPSSLLRESPSLAALLRDTGPLSPYSVILGTCEDGLPFLLDLTNPAPGALLIIGDAHSGKSRLLRSILASATLLNPPDQVVFSLVTRDDNDFSGIIQAENCQEVFFSYERPGSELVVSLAEEVERRRRGQTAQPAVILAIDDLAAFMQYMDNGVLSCFYSLLRHGPRSQVWTIATLLPDEAALIDERMLSAFRTRLIGSIASADDAAFLAGGPHSGAESLPAGYQFCVPFGEEWIRFWICNAE